MRIAFITTSFPLSDYSSSGVFVEKLAYHLAQKNAMTVATPAASIEHTVTSSKPYKINTFRYAPWKWQLISHQPGGIPVAFKRHRWLILLLPGFLISMLVIAIRDARKADIIHANWAVTGAIAGIAGKLTDTPVVTTLRGSDISRSENSWIDRLILKLCLATNNKIITVCSPLATNVGNYFPWAKYKLLSIPNGVDDSFLNVKKQQAVNKVFRVVSVGSLIPRKNMSLIIHAIAELTDISNICIEIIGGGIEYDLLRQLGDDLALGDRLKMTGDIPSDEIPAHLEMADVFVLSSNAEGRPNALIEAMAAGVPVIATNIEGVTDVISHECNGLLFHTGNHVALAQALRRLYDNPGLRNKFSEQGRDYILQNKLSWVNCAMQYLDVYQEILKK